MIAAVVDQEDLNGQMVVDDGLQLLQVHLDAAVAGHQDDILCMVCQTGADGRRKVIAHGSDGRVADEPLPLLHLVGMTAHHAGGTVSDHSDLILLSPSADLLDGGIDVGRLILSGFIVLREHHRIFFLPLLAAGDPPVHSFLIFGASVCGHSLYLQDHFHLLQKILYIGMDRHIHMDCGLL